MLRKVASLSLLSLPLTALDAAPIETINVTAMRLSEPVARKAYAKSVIGEDALQNAPQLRLDDILRTVPGLGLFRRSSSMVAHPTTQGVTLRGIGPNGAGRALVMLDGIPLNDPFGGWVPWAGLDPNRLSHVDILPGSGAGPYGNQAISGVISLNSRLPRSFAGWADARYGSFDTLALSFGLADTFGPLGVTVSGAHSESDGFILRTKDQRGSIDVPAASTASSLNGSVVWSLGPHTTISSRIRWFDEKRTNGTPLARNDTSARDVSMTLVHDGRRDGPDIQITSYWQNRKFANIFTSVTDDERSQERPVLDQFDVPAWGLGGSALIRFPFASDSHLEVGMDARRLSGNSHELARNLGAGFTRLREAGGDQMLVGGWLEYAGSLTNRLSVAGGIRLDYWRIFNVIMQESEIGTEALVRSDDIANRKDNLLNGRLGLAYDVTPAMRLRLAGYSGFRLPTINEYFRPFRVGNDITEANPELDTERLYGVEAGISFSPLNSFTVTLDIFRNWLDRGVGNITLHEGPGFFPPAGFVPGNGSLRQRLNIDHIIADGLAISTDLSLSSQWRLAASYLYSRARITGFSRQPDLVGNRLAQSPKHSGTAEIEWTPDNYWTMTAQLRLSGARFEDDMMERRLDEAVTADLAVSRQILRNMTFTVRAENIWNSRVVSQIDGSGLLTRTDPQAFYAGLHYRF